MPGLVPPPPSPPPLPNTTLASLSPHPCLHLDGPQGLELHKTPARFSASEAPVQPDMFVVTPPPHYPLPYALLLRL